MSSRRFSGSSISSGSSQPQGPRMKKYPKEKFCFNCGGRLAKGPFCPSCGTNVSHSTKNEKKHCRYGKKCNKKNCHFYHPKKIGDVSPKKHKKKPCRYGNNCININCKFLHFPKKTSPDLFEPSNKTTSSKPSNKTFECRKVECDMYGKPFNGKDGQKCGKCKSNLKQTQFLDYVARFFKK